MEDSFVQYRDMTVDESDESDNVIDDSQNSMTLSNRKKTNVSKAAAVHISESDYESSNDDTDESFVIKPKTNRVLRLESDPESDDDISDEPRQFSSTTRRSIFGTMSKTNRCSDSSDESDIIVSDSKEDESSDDLEMAPNPHVGFKNLDISPVKNMDMSVADNSISSPEKGADMSTDASPFLNKLGSADSPAKMDISNVNASNMNMSVTSDSLRIVEKESDIVVSLSSEDNVPEIIMVTPKVKNKSFRKSTQPKINAFLGQSSVKKEKKQIVFVSKQTKENETRKVEKLRSEFSQVDTLVKSANMERLPDNGIKLIERYKWLKVELNKQIEKVANMEVEPDIPTKDHLKNDGFLSWEQLQEGSKAVKPKTFGAQALNTHMSQQILTLERLKVLHSSLGTRPEDDAKATPPKNLVTELMQHQLHALAWLSWRETQQPRGGILADDMGLGKTLTMISLILHSKENNLNDPEDNAENDEEWSGKSNGKLTVGGTLVVCPASLLSQWHNEIVTHCKRHSLRDEIHHGNNRETKSYHLARNDVVITTYNIVQRDVQKNGVLMRIRWQRIILDEAHVVRNHKSLTATAIFKLVAHSRWCLTGTPVHNKDLDLFSLLKFLRCSPFDDIVLWRKWIDNKSTGGEERLATVMKTLMLRRTKQQLQEQNSLKSLPEKASHFIEVDLSKDEMKVYQKVLLFSKNLFAQFLDQRAQKQNYMGEGGSNSNKNQEEFYRLHKKMVAMKGLKEVKSHEILVLLLRLRQICCHPGLIHAMLRDEDDDLNTSESRGEVDTALLAELSKLNIEKDLESEDDDNQNTIGEGVSVSKAIKQVLHISNPVFDLKNKSSKVEAVIDCLEKNVFVHKKDKAIIVSQWTSMLEVIEGNLKEMKVKCLTFSGKVPVASRQDIIAKFNDPNSETKILLLSLCAGGVGLNLIGANHLLLTDLHWNPQLEAQAQDRIYRVGQKKPVHIYKFVCRETLEQSIKLLQDKKLNLANNILTGAKMIHSSKLSIDDLKLMFNMH